MKGVRQNQRRWRWASAIFVCAAALMVFWQLLPTAMGALTWLLSGLGALLVALLPIGSAFIVAYLVHPSVDFLERKLLKRLKNRERLCYSLAVVLCYAALAGLLGSIAIALVPALVRNVRDVMELLPRYINSFRDMVDNLGAMEPSGQLAQMLETMQAQASVQLDGMMQSVMGGVLKMVSSVISMLVALVVSFYLLMERKALMGGVRMCAAALLGERRTLRASALLQKLDRVFGRYAAGKLLEALAVTAMCLAGFWAIGVPYAVLMAVLVGLFSLIPYFGPLIAAVPVVLVTLVDAPSKLVYVGAVFLVVFVIDGYVIGPKLIGGKLGLSTFWVVFGVLVGGRVAGVWGMVLGIPAVAVLRIGLYSLLYRHKRRQKRKHEAQALEMFDIHDE